MICPRCEVQMHQAIDQVRKNTGDEADTIHFLGGGDSSEIKYSTWMIQECPACGRLYKESYSCELLASPKFMKKTIETIDDMHKLHWLPHAGAFQLSEDKKYARHDLAYKLQGKYHIADTEQMVWKSYGLRPFIKDDFYQYFK